MLIFDVLIFLSDSEDNAVQPGSGLYNAYMDPSNPGDILLSVPMNDEEFDDEQKEGVGNRNLNENGYLYGLADAYKEDDDAKEQDDGIPSVAKAASTGAVAVAVTLDDDDDDDDFAERPRVQPASINAIGIAPPPKSKKAPKNVKRKSVKQVKAQPNAIASNHKGPLAETLLSTNVHQPMISDQNSGSLN